ncbi:MAG TPA: DUF2059 domain-containing protein [Candidatus Acidoferrum sp.]|nr:DUF2059 domain-containing protein [Candidatus Acidoferrum sp.]
MRPLLVGCALLSGALLVLAHAPSLQVNAQEKAAVAKPSSQASAKGTPQASSAIDPQKQARIRELMDVTGAKNLGQQLIEAGMEQFRSSVQDSQPDNPRAKQFVDAFVARFQKHFDFNSLTDRIIPIYDKYLTTDDLKGLLDYYQSPLGQRMLKTLPEVTRESQAAGFALGQKAAQDTMEELKADFPEFTGSKDQDKHPGGDQK